MTNNQVRRTEADFFGLVDDILRDEHRGFSFRNSKISRQFEKSNNNLGMLDIHFALAHEKRNFVRMGGAGERYLVNSLSIDDEPMLIVFVWHRSSDLEIVNVWLGK